MAESRKSKFSKGDGSQESGGVDVRAWFEKLDEYLDEPFMPEGRQQPASPAPRNLFRE